MKIPLKNVSLVAVASTHHNATIKALKYSSRFIEFGKILFFSEINPYPRKKFFKYVKTEKFNNISEWGKFIVFDLHKYISTPYIILIHADGFIVNPKKWTNKFLDFDYIGAPWPSPEDRVTFRDGQGKLIRVGNSVSLRSKKILELPTKLNLKWDNFLLNIPHEDGFLCVQHGSLLEKNGIKFAPLEVAAIFSREYPIPENKNVEPFLFHKWVGENKQYPNFIKHSFSNKFSNFLKNLWIKFKYK
jgi:hypothetical protein